MPTLKITYLGTDNKFVDAELDADDIAALRKLQIKQSTDGWCLDHHFAYPGQITGNLWQFLHVHRQPSVQPTLYRMNYFGAFILAYIDGTIEIEVTE